jgi:hypothetical protein
VGALYELHRDISGAGDGNPQTDKLRYLHRDHIIANMRDRFLDAEVRFELSGRA